MEAAAEPADCVMAAIVGAAGLEPTFEAARQGRRVALANKECLVSAGDVFMSAVAQVGRRAAARRFSEHSAALQALAGAEPDEHRDDHADRFRRPFPHLDVERLSRATPEEALHHPNWSMGAKITIDSATLDEQGPGADRGLSPVPGACRPARRRRAPAVDRALPRQLRRRLRAGAALRAGHAYADRAGAVVAATHVDPDAPARSRGAREA